MEKARVKENKTRWGSSLFLSLDASVFRARFFVLARRFSAVSKRVLYSSVLHFPSRVSSTVFFSLMNLGFESFQALWDPVSETTFFRPSSEHPPPERESEREAAMKIHLKTLCVVLSKRFPGRSFPSSLSTTLRVSSFRNGFLSSPLFF